MTYLRLVHAGDAQTRNQALHVRRTKGVRHPENALLNQLLRGWEQRSKLPVGEPHSRQFGASPLEAGTLLFRTTGVQGGMS